MASVIEPQTFSRDLEGPQGPFWTGAENFASTGIQSLDRPARSESLYLLRYLGPQCAIYQVQLKMICISIKCCFVPTVSLRMANMISQNMLEKK